MDKFSFIGNAEIGAIDNLYQSYLKDPSSVDEGWSKFFEGFEFARTNFEKDAEIPENFQKEFKVINLINGYRSRGHLFTRTNPVRERRQYTPTLDIENFGLQDSDLETVFQAGTEIGTGPSTLSEIIRHLKETYCQSIGLEYAYMREPERLAWFRQKIELSNRPVYDKARKQLIFSKLNKASNFEAYLQKKYVGQKRFSIEGGEALIPALDALIEKGSELGVKEFIMGMAHRGRLNSLTNIFEKLPRDIFAEFDGKLFDSDETFDGDVKYHQGYSTDEVERNGQKLHLSLAPNPSHLEAVAPVVEGIVRAKIDQYLIDNSKICPVIIHGDAAIAGQGVVYEVVQMAHLEGYKTGGTIHVVVNNQVGFTTNYKDARSSTYCTDVAKTTLCPIFHVNGDDIEAVIYVFEVAIEYRQKFKRDVFIDLLCYRKYGHNEGDEPKFTQPNLYKLIANHPNPREIYLEQLLSEGNITTQEANDMENKYLQFLEDEHDISKKKNRAVVWNFLEKPWKGFRHGNDSDFDKSPETGVDKKKLLALGTKLSTLPDGKNYFRKIQKIYEDRLKAIQDDKLDWGSAEMLAYATLLVEGHAIRFSGQDVERGTFSHRHAVVITEDTEEKVETLNLLSKDQAHFSIYNSLLSEYAVLGFEYGYSLASPQALTIWEAQFGDFYNGAQIMVDQFIAAGEDKWSTQSGLVMLLPHGYEGMGAEHSSARIERFLQMGADLNMQLVNTSTPANHFHVLRRQLHRDFRKPLVVFSPKMLLRYPAAVSSLDEMKTGSFQEVIDDQNAKLSEIDTLVLCSGKFYYELIEKAAELGAENMAFVRVEQLYPFPQKQLDVIFKKYSKAKNIIWAQEEPENMGAWRYMAMQLATMDLIGVTREVSAAPAEGSKELHLKRLARVLDGVFQYASVKVK
ncbi:MAG: 2-oxoglutarate dehydrogenase E1 component [Crocinitomicaceae bacterium]